MQDFINEILKISTDNFYYLHFIIPFTLTMTILPFGVRILSYFNIYDVPNSRKVHTIPIPSTGGVIIYFCFILTSLIFLPFKDIMPAYIAGSGFLVFIGFRLHLGFFGFLFSSLFNDHISFGFGYHA